uniref:Uncharacterized protein n=1 Tax=viral metagenome TaxID=1070528 RepID=A0A6M3XTY0_9ZZZZ
MLLSGKWIRIECDVKHPEDYYHPDSTLDLADQSLGVGDMIRKAKVGYGWKYKKGEWICPYCQKNNPYIKNTKQPNDECHLQGE